MQDLSVAACERTIRRSSLAQGASREQRWRCDVGSDISESDAANRKKKTLSDCFTAGKDLIVSCLASQLGLLVWHDGSSLCVFMWANIAF